MRFCSGALIARYVYATHVNVPDLIIKGGVVYRVLTDQLGSVRAIVNAGTGAVAETFDYDSFGNMTTANPALCKTPDLATCGTATSGLQTFAFAGGMFDTDTGLYRFGARDYDPVMGPLAL